MKAPERKTRPDAVLLNLPEGRQDEIGAMMLPGEDNKSHAEIQKLLAADGIHVSQQVLSRFYTWWVLRKQYQETEQTVDTLVKLKAEEGNFSEEELFAYGQKMFAARAIKDQRPKVWSMIQKLRQKEKDRKFQEEKFREAIKGDIERAMDALFEEIKGNKAALEFFQKFKAAVQGATK